MAECHFSVTRNMTTAIVPATGHAVSIIYGPLAGVTGRLMAERDSQWIIELQRGVLVAINAAHCEALTQGDSVNSPLDA